MSKAIQSTQGLPVIHERAAGIDIGSRFHVVAVPPHLCEEPIQTFQAFTADLQRMANWLKSLHIETVVMESTGVYWVPVYEVLETAGIAVMVANARETRSVPGRKSDINDAQWLQRLHACGLLRASFRPGRDIAALRAYLRHRERLLDYTAAHIQHMQKALTFMNVQLHHVVQDITGATGMKIIRAIVRGERDPDVLAEFRDVRCKASTEIIRGALVGNYQPEHVFALTQSLALYDFYQARIDECDEQIEQALAVLNADKPLPNQPIPEACHRTRQPNAVNFDVRSALYQLVGTDPNLTVALLQTSQSAKSHWFDTVGKPAFIVLVIVISVHNCLDGVNRRAKLSRVLGKRALKSFHPRLFNARLFAGESWSDRRGRSSRNSAVAFCGESDRQRVGQTIQIIPPHHP